jgi:hypothetical protein
MRKDQKEAAETTSTGVAWDQRSINQTGATAPATGLIYIAQNPQKAQQFLPSSGPGDGCARHKNRGMLSSQ